MGQKSLHAVHATPRDRKVRTSLALLLALGLGFLGCSTGTTDGTNPTDLATASANDNSGLSLPPGFKTVEIPLDQRREVFKESHSIRALAVQEANLELPMDEAHLPHLDTQAFDKRVAEHKSIINRIAGKNLAALADKYKISVADVEKIEEEANRLRWLPPTDPVFKGKETNEKAEKKSEIETKSKDTK